jgi:hypothetical protein
VLLKHGIDDARKFCEQQYADGVPLVNVHAGPGLVALLDGALEQVAESGGWTDVSVTVLPGAASGDDVAALLRAKPAMLAARPSVCLLGDHVFISQVCDDDDDDDDEWIWATVAQWYCV